MNIKIHSIFSSIDGEVNSFGQGTFTTFIRFAGCDFAGHDAHCSYCDTSYAWGEDSALDMGVDEIVEKIIETGCRKVTITGGEPRRQYNELHYLVNALKDKGFFISLETNGSYSMDVRGSYLNRIDCIVMDWKLSNSGVSKFMKYTNFLDLREYDFIKFVVDEDTINEAVKVKMHLQNLGCKARFAFSPLWGKVNPEIVVATLYELGQVDAVFNLQIHKVVWPNIGFGEEH